MLLHDLGEGLMLAAELVLQVSDLAVLGIRNDLVGFDGLLEGSGAVLEELLLPAVELGSVNAVFVAQIGDRDFFQEVLAQDRNLILGGVVAAGLAHAFVLR